MKCLIILSLALVAVVHSQHHAPAKRSDVLSRGYRSVLSAPVPRSAVYKRETEDHAAMGHFKRSIPEEFLRARSLPEEFATPRKRSASSYRKRRGLQQVYKRSADEKQGDKKVELEPQSLGYPYYGTGYGRYPYGRGWGYGR